MPAFKDMQFCREELIEVVLGQGERIQQLEALVEQHRALVEQLRLENEMLRRQAKRQAAPFSKGTINPNPKKPGRKAGKLPLPGG